MNLPKLVSISISNFKVLFKFENFALTSFCYVHYDVYKCIKSLLHMIEVIEHAGVLLYLNYHPVPSLSLSPPYNFKISFS